MFLFPCDVSGVCKALLDVGRTAFEGALFPFGLVKPFYMILTTGTTVNSAEVYLGQPLIYCHFYDPTYSIWIYEYGLGFAGGSGRGIM